MAAPPWRCLRRIADYTFAIEGTDPQLRELAEALYSGAAAEQGEPAIRFTLTHRPRGFALLQDGARAGAAPTLAGLFQEAEWALTEAALLRLGHFFQLHAGAVAGQSSAWLLVGPPESGKTSLALALAARGHALLTDEIALVDPRCLRVTPFGRDLIVRPGTLTLFPSLAPRVPPFKRSPDGLYLSPGLAGEPPPRESMPIGQLVFPRLRLGSGVELRPLGAAEAARRLLEQALNLGDWEAAGMDLVGRLAEGFPALELVFGDAREAAEALAEVGAHGRVPLRSRVSGSKV